MAYIDKASDVYFALEASVPSEILDAIIDLPRPPLRDSFNRQHLHRFVVGHLIIGVDPAQIAAAVSQLVPSDVHTRPGYRAYQKQVVRYLTANASRYRR